MDLEGLVQRLVAEAPEQLARHGAAERAVLADRIAGSYVDSLAARALGYRGFAKLVRGGNAPEQALMKAFVSEALREAALVGSEVAGDGGTDLGAPGHLRSEACSWIEIYYATFGGTISAGTSEIQRNIIAERVLGLPKG